MLKTIGIYPWVADLTDESDKHQKHFTVELEKKGFIVKRILYKKGFPITNALKNNVDVLILDWVHSFYTSKSILSTIIKSFFGLMELICTPKWNTKVIWNLHNLKRHDGKFERIEKFCFQRLAKKVTYIRVFDRSHVEKVSKYLQITPHKIIVIEQGPYVYENIIEVDIRKRYDVKKDKNILLFFGSVRQGKGLEQFLETFSKLKLNDWVFLIAGKGGEKILEEKVLDITDSSSNIIFDNRYIPDEEVESYFRQCNRIVLPYENTLNSGILLLAKTFNTQVIANTNFKDLLGLEDQCGDLLNPLELQKMLSTNNIKDNSKNHNKNLSWKNIIEEFQKYI